MPSILFVFTSADATLGGQPTGWYLPEAAHPYYILVPHCRIDFASPKGPNPPVDQGSVQAFSNDGNAVKFLRDETVQTKLANAKRLQDVKVEDYDAIFYVGGHGAAIDLPFESDNANLLSKFYQAGKIVSAVCHGPAALVEGVDADGNSIFKGKRFTGFSNEEETIVEKTKEVPFLLETKITDLGGIYERAAVWQSKVVIDGQLLTGQNPASAAPLGEAILKALTKCV